MSQGTALARVLKALVAAVLYASCVILIYRYTIHSANWLSWRPHTYSELLINYSAGFVRRGLLGAWIRRETFGGPALAFSNRLVFFNYLILVTALSALVLSARPNRLRNLIFVLAVPGGAFAMAVTREFFARKEAFFLTGLTVVALLSVLVRRLPSRVLRRCGAALLIVIIFLLGLGFPLLHEAFLLISAPAWTVLLCSLASEFASSAGQQLRLQKRLAICYLVPVLLLFIVLGHFHGNQQTAQSIWNNLNPHDRYAISSDGQITGGIEAMSMSLLGAVSMPVHVITSGMAWFWLVPVSGLALYCLGLVASNLSDPNPRLEFRRWLLLYGLLYATAAPVFALGWDWGRWIAAVNNNFLVLWLALGTPPARLESAEWLQRIRGLTVVRPVRVVAFRYMSLVERHPRRVLSLLLLFAFTFRLPEGAMEPTNTNYAFYEAHRAAEVLAHHGHRTP